MATLSSQRRFVVVCTLILAAGMLLFPPWKYLQTIGSEGVGSVTVSRSAGYHAIFSPPEVNTEALQNIFNATYGLFEVRIDVIRLMMQLAFLALAGSCAYVITPFFTGPGRSGDNRS